MKDAPTASLIAAAKAARRDASALRALMDFYACDDGDDQLESEADLRAQLSGILGDLVPPHRGL